MKGVRNMIDLELLRIVVVGPTDEALLIQLLEKKEFGTNQIRKCLRRLLKDGEIRVTSENCYAITASGKELLALLRRTVGK
jgi:DNA-binding PadR family transcriptional regulator